MKNKVLKILLPLLILGTILFIVQCHYDAADILSGSYRSAYPDNGFEKKIFSNATLKDDFSLSSIVIVLSKSASLDFKTYTADDFPEIRLERVTDSTANTMELIKMQQEAEMSNDWSKLKKHIDNAMLVDINNFRRILDCTLRCQAKKRS